LSTSFEKSLSGFRTCTSDIAAGEIEEEWKYEYDERLEVTEWKDGWSVVVWMGLMELQASG